MVKHSFIKFMIALSVVVICTVLLLTMQTQRMNPSRMESQDSMELRVVMRSRLAMDDGKYHEAEKICEALLKHYPDSMRGKEALGLALLQQGQGGRAEEIFRELAEKYPYDGSNFRYLAIALHLQNRHEAAMRELEKSYAADDKSPITANLLSAYYKQANNPEMSKKYENIYNALQEKQP